MKKIMLLFLVLSIAGCVGIPLSSVYKMMTADPLEFNPGAISIAIKSSNAIKIHIGDVEMNMFINSDDSGLSVSQQYFLAVDNTPRIPLLAEGLIDNEALTVLTLSPEDVVRMTSLQKTMKKHLLNGGNRSDFGFNVRVLGGCKNTKDIPENVFVSLFLKLGFSSDFFPLYEDFDIGQADLSPLKNLASWDDCNS